MPKRSAKNLVNTSLGIRLSSHEKLTAERHNQILKSIDEIQFKMNTGDIDAGHICLYGIN